MPFATRVNPDRTVGGANPVWATWASGKKEGKGYTLSDMHDKTFIVRYVMGDTISIFYG